MLRREEAGGRLSNGRIKNAFVASLTSGTLLSLFLRLWNFLILFSSVLLELLKFQYTASLRHRVIGYEFAANLLLLFYYYYCYFFSVLLWSILEEFCA